MTGRGRGATRGRRATSLRTHHEDLLLVHLHHAAGELAHRLSDADDETVHRVAPGLALLSRLERSGHLTGCDHLRRREAATPWSRSRVHHRVREAAADARAMDHGGALLLAVRTARAHADLHRALRRDPHVRSVSLVPRRYALAPAARHTIAGLFPPPRRWHLQRIGWDEARARRGFQDGRSVRVAVLDTGVDEGHPALAPSVAEYVHRYRDLASNPGARDLMGHGTHVSGIIAAREVRGAAARDLHACGVSRCRLHVFKIFSDEPQEEPALNSFLFVVDPRLLYRALADCLEQRVDVVNMSIGGPGAPDPYEARLVEALVAQGTSVVAAMGNARMAGSPVQYPAATPGVIAVGATDPDDLVASFSNAGPHIALCAPGVGIWSTLPRYAGPCGFRESRRRGHRGPPVPRNTVCDAWPGTSMATPLVAGAVALLKANRPRFPAADVRAQLMRTADHVPGMGRAKFTDDYGAGRLNVRRLLAE